MNYPGVTFGEHLIPYVDLHSNVEKPYSVEEVITEEIPGVFQIPDSVVRDLKEEIVTEMENKYKNFYDGPLARLVDYRVDDDNHKLHLTVQRTSYSTHSATNRSIDNPEVRRMVEERGGFYENLDNGLANAIGVSVVILSEPDNALVTIQRSEELHQYPGLLGVPAGFMNPEKHGYVVFNTGTMETKEEAGIPVKTMRFLGLGQAGDDGHSEVSLIAKTEYTKQQIISSPKSGKWEGRILPENIVPFEPKPMMEKLTNVIKEVPKGVPTSSNLWVPGRTPKWVPSQWVAVNDTLMNIYGFDEVWNAYQEVTQ